MTEQPIVFRLPMRARFRGITARTGMLLSGPAGWAEWSPFEEYEDAEAAAWLRATDEARLEGWPAGVRSRVPVNCTIPAIGPERAEQLAVGSGCRTAKIKVAEPGQDLRADLDRVAAVRSALGPDGRIRIDANGNWSLDQAIAALTALSAYDLEYAEQPCRATADLARLRRRTNVAIAADESIRRADDPHEVARLEAADVAVLKVQPLGGVRSCLRIAADIGLPVVVSSALESSIGIAAGLALAAALPELPYACGLATVSMFHSDLVAAPLLPVDGAIAVPDARPVPAAPLPPEAIAGGEDRARWLARLERVRDTRATR